MGFLFARVATDRIIEGSLDPHSMEVGTQLYAEIIENLLLPQDSAHSTSHRALLRALAVAGEIGLPAGDVWRAAAEGLSPEGAITWETQLTCLDSLARFILEERDKDQLVYRLFHQGLRAALLHEGDASGVIRGLKELRRRQSRDWADLSGMDPYLRFRLPKLVADFPSELSATLEGAPEVIREEQVNALLDRSENLRALGKSHEARELTHLSVGAVPHGTRTHARALLQQSISILALDEWRKARDLSSSAIQITEQLLADNDDDIDVIRDHIRATRVYAQSEGVGAFDADRGSARVDRLLVHLLEEHAGAIGDCGDVLADLLLSYADSLSWAVGERAAGEAAGAASRMFGWYVARDREDLRTRYATAVTYEAFFTDSTLGSLRLESFRRAGEVLLERGSIKSSEVMAIRPVMGELISFLGLSGHHDEALGWLGRAIEMVRPTIDIASSTDRYPAAYVDLFLLRSTIYDVLGDVKLAVHDAQRAVELCGAFDIPTIDKTAARAVLALRLWDAALEHEAARLLDAFDDGVAPQIVKATVCLRALCKSRELVAHERVEEAAGVLDSVFERHLANPRLLERILFDDFNLFGLELRLGSALAELWRHLGQHARADRVVDDAATAFLTNVLAPDPWRVLHLQPQLFRTWIPSLRRSARYLKVGPQQDRRLIHVLGAVTGSTQEMGGRPRSSDILKSFIKAEEAMDGEVLVALAPLLEERMAISPSRARSAALIGYALRGDNARAESVLETAELEIRSRLLIALELHVALSLS